MIAAVFFDVGGVIYDDGRYREALIAGLRELGVDEPAAFARVYERCRRKQAGSFRHALARELLGNESRAAELGAAAAPHWTLPADALLPDAPAALHALAGRYRLGIVANQRSLARSALERDGLARLFDAWAISEDVGAEKPDRRIFEAALAAAGVRADAAAHVGNRLDTDVRGARAAGLRAIWLPRGEGPDAPTPEQRAEADAVIGSLAELPDALARIA